MPDLMSPEQRKGLLYGSLISAILGAASGGNIREALGNAAVGASSGYGGGMEDVMKAQREDLERQAAVEKINASHSGQNIAQQKFNWEKQSRPLDQLLKSWGLQREMRTANEQDTIQKNLQDYMGQDISKAENPYVWKEGTKPTFNPLEQFMIQNTPIARMNDVYGHILGNRAATEKMNVADQPWKDEQGNWHNLPKGAQIPPGWSPMREATMPSQVFNLGNELQVEKPGQPTRKMPVSVSPNVGAEITSREKIAGNKEANVKPNPKRYYKMNADGTYSFQTLDTNSLEADTAAKSGWNIIDSSTPKFISLMEQKAGQKSGATVPKGKPVFK